ncbi:CaiB/BaiF CoA transferase family protein [Actinospongicola halichondriae]|uniref:CaiB/BaiF CoA transferase family protein n=1 Tax=Actinospongicola halichondriae TaxID=3236844 RepID=UPI003D39D168
MQAPLDGIRILAVEQMQALPYATQLLARLGADVVKVEHPTRGDLGRGSQPSMTDESGASVGATYLRNNLAKRSIGLDLGHPDAKQVFLDLVPHFDVVAENFKPGGMAKFGLSYDDIVDVHPGVVYVSVSGFGNTVESPYGHWPAFAPIAEAMSGMYAFNRPADEPVKVSPVGALGDTGSGLFAAIGLLSALRKKDRTGEGSYVDISMFDCMVAFADIVPNYFSMGRDPRDVPPLINHGFAIASGEVVIQVGRPHQFAKLVETIGHPEWADDDRFATAQGWVDNLDVLREALGTWAGDRSTIAVAEVLAAAGIAAAPIFEAADLVDDPHVRARHMLTEIPRTDGVDRPVLTPGNPVKISDHDDATASPPPMLGQHTDEILGGELGLSAERLAELRAADAIG